MMNAPRVESSAVSELAIAAVARSLIEAMMVDEGKWIADEIFTLFWLVVHVGHSAAESDHNLDSVKQFKQSVSNN